MNSQGPRDPEDRFEEAYREWLSRPPGLSPAQAAGRVSERLHTRGRARSWMAAAAASLLAGAIGISIWWTTARVATAPIATPAPLGSGEVLMWLDDQTPLYMTFQSEAEPKGGEK